MREQKSRANWLNTENARCHRTVYITMQNVSSKLQIGLSPEMGWYPVSFTIIVNKDVWMCTPGRCSWALFKDGLRPLRFSLHSWCLKSFLFWRLSIRYCSFFFHSCIFHSRNFSAPVHVLGRQARQHLNGRTANRTAIANGSDATCAWRAETVMTA